MISGWKKFKNHQFYVFTVNFTCILYVVQNMKAKHDEEVDVGEDIPLDFFGGNDPIDSCLNLK